jgi:hypothetical protein
VSAEELTGAGQANGLATTSATCAGCGAPLVADQRYCLACGQPASPVRLAFLDVLQGEYRAPDAGGTPVPPGAQVYAAYPAAPEPDGLLGALRRYSGLLALVGVLLASLLIGLLVGHWATGGANAAGGKQVVEVKIPGGILGAAPAAADSSAAGANGTSPGTSAGSKTGSASSAHAAAKSEKNESAAEEEARAEKEVKSATAPPPVKKKASSSALQKLEHSTGKKHEKEVSKLISGDEPIETH